jgi:hypothetical protein
MLYADPANWLKPRGTGQDEDVTSDRMDIVPKKSARAVFHFLS